MRSEIVKGTKVGPAFFLGVIAHCLDGTDEPQLPPSGNLRGPSNGGLNLTLKNP